MALDAAETAALLHAVPAAYNTQINDALLAALGLAFADWLGRSALLVEIEGHGREPLFDDIDLSRTVGWFTSMFPLVLDLRAAGGPAEALRATKEQLRRVPHNGIGYGLLRYLNEPAGAALRALPQAQVSFNYLGQIDQTPAGGAFGPAPEPPGPSQSPADPRSHLIDINALVAGGCLHAEWTYCPRIHSAETIERLAQDFAGALRAIIAHCRQPEAGGYTPSDFPLARLSQPQLDALIGTGPRARAAIDDIYPLAPMQQGMLFHSLYAPESGIYVEQLSCELRGALDTQAFEQAWRHVAAQHPILRTSFAWEGLDAPLQLVWRDPPLPVTVNGYVPAAALLPTVMVIAEVPAPGAAIDDGLKLAVTFAGRPDTDKPTAALKPPLTAVVIVDVPDDPLAIVTADGEAAIVKSGATVGISCASESRFM